jgi:hypothetical protein
VKINKIKQYLSSLLLISFLAVIYCFNSFKNFERETMQREFVETRRLGNLLLRVLPIVDPQIVPDDLSISQLKEIIKATLPEDDRFTTDSNTLANFERDAWGNPRLMSIIHIDGNRYVRLFSKQSNPRAAWVTLTVIIGPARQDIPIYGYIKQIGALEETSGE